MDGLIKEVDDELTDLFQQIMNGSFVAYFPIFPRILWTSVDIVTILVASLACTLFNNPLCRSVSQSAFSELVTI